MFLTLERMVALRYLRTRRREGFISVIAGFSLLGISLGVATLIIVMAVMNGFRHELLDRILGLNGHLSLHGTTEKLLNSDMLAAAVRDLPRVLSVIPVVSGQVMVVSSNNALGAVVQGVEPRDIHNIPRLWTSIKTGNLTDFRDTDVVIIGQRLADKLRVTVGDSVTLISPAGNVTALGTIPRLKSFVIIATFSVGMYEYDSSFVYIPLVRARLYFNLPQGSVSYLEIMLDDPDKVSEVTQWVTHLVENKSGIRVLGWQQVNSAFFNAIQVERNVMFLILTLIIVVAAFNIISGLILLVKDKGKDIAILRTMGAKRHTIMFIFFLSGVSIGSIGTLVGTTIGLLFSFNIEIIRQTLQEITRTDLFADEIYFLSHMPAKVDPGEVITVALIAIGLSFCATLYPAWRAARLNPVEALRYS